MRNPINRFSLSLSILAVVVLVPSRPHTVLAAPKYPGPCRYTTGASLEMLNINNAKCHGVPGTRIEIEVVTSLKADLAGISFQPPPHGTASVGSYATPPLYTPWVFAFATFGPYTGPGSKFTGLNRGSLYNVTASAALCLGMAKTRFAWYAYGITILGTVVPGPPIDIFFVTCP